MDTIIDALRRVERHFLGREALAGAGARLTNRELLDRCRRLGSVLPRLGAAPGDRVAILSGNSVPYVELFLGVPACGRVQVPLNFRWTEPELAYAIEDAGAKILFCDRDPGALGDLVEEVVRTDTGAYEEMVLSSEPAELASGLTGATLAGLFYTGGTTGMSKGVMLTHGNLVANAIAMQLFAPYEPDDVFLVAAPMFHAAGSFSVIQCGLVGARQVIMPFEPGAVLDTVEHERVTVTAAVPTMIAALIDEQLSRPRDVTSLRLVVHGGSFMATELARQWTLAFPGAELVHVYGSTETSPVITGLRHEERHLGTPRERSCGIPPIGHEVEIRDENGNAIADGEVGEVAVRGPHVMAGYWNKPDETAAALRGGWYHTGDIGTVDHDGYVYLLDRLKDMIITGGENVYSTEVEEALYRHPAVLEVAVFGIPDVRWGETVHALVVPRAEVTPEELAAHCRKLIAAYKVPRSFAFQAEPLPKSGPGKVLKRELREPYWADRDRRLG